MVESLLLYPDGVNEVVNWQHEKVSSNLGGAVTFVGAIPELKVFVVALQESSSYEVNSFCKDSDIFMELPVRGPVLFVATDREGEPICVNVCRLKEKLSLE